MNLENLEKIAAWLENGGDNSKATCPLPGFNLKWWYITENTKKEYGAQHEIVGHFENCGSICCIAGAAVHFFTNDVHKRRDYYAEGRQALGLDADQAACLFGGIGVGTSAVGNDAAWAARCVRKLMATGVVDWVGTRDESEPA